MDEARRVHRALLAAFSEPGSTVEELERAVLFSGTYDFPLLHCAAREPEGVAAQELLARARAFFSGRCSAYFVFVPEFDPDLERACAEDSFHHLALARYPE